MTRRPWTTAEVKLLAHLIKRGVRRALICEKLGRTKASVRTQITRMGLQSRGQRNWDDVQDEALKAALRAGHTLRRIAFDTDRTVPGIKGRMLNLGLFFKRPETFGGQPMPCRRHMTRQFGEVLQLVRQGLSNAAIARQTGRRRGTVMAWRKAA